MKEIIIILDIDGYHDKLDPIIDAIKEAIRDQFIDDYNIYTREIEEVWTWL